MSHNLKLGRTTHVAIDIIVVVRLFFALKLLNDLELDFIVLFLLLFELNLPGFDSAEGESLFNYEDRWERLLSFFVDVCPLPTVEGDPSQQPVRDV